MQTALAIFCVIAVIILSRPWVLHRISLFAFKIAKGKRNFSIWLYESDDEGNRHLSIITFILARLLREAGVEVKEVPSFDDKNPLLSDRNCVERYDLESHGVSALVILEVDQDSIGKEGRSVGITLDVIVADRESPLSQYVWIQDQKALLNSTEVSELYSLTRRILFYLLDFHMMMKPPKVEENPVAP